MATRNWLGNAVATKDKWDITVANVWAAGDTGTITINGKDLVVTMGTSTTTTALVADELKRAWESAAFADATSSCVPSGGGTTIPEMAEYTATVSGSVVTLTMDTAGNVPHTISVSEVTAGSGTLSIVHTITGTGPNDWNNVDNWSGATLPVSTDTVVIDRPVSILMGLDQNAVTLTSLTITERFTSSAYIGLPSRNSGGYEEYRETFLKISATTFTSRSTSGRIKWNAGSVQTAATIHSTGSTAETGKAAFQFIGTHASNVATVLAGDVSIAGVDGDVATVATLTHSGGTLVCGSGATLTTVKKDAGTLTLWSNTTSLTSFSGSLSLRAGTHTALTMGGGTLAVAGATTVTTLTVAAGTATATESATITTLRQTGGTVTCTAGVSLTTIDKLAGTLTINSTTVTTLTNESGTVNCNQGSITTANISGGTCKYGGTAITTMNLANATLDLDWLTTANCTITTLTISAPATIIDSAQRLTVTNGLPMPHGTLTYTGV